MAYSSRSTLGPAHLRQTSISANALGASTAGKSLQARVEEKRAELEDLKQLRELSGAVASQMEALEEKLSTLSDGTEAIATVMANWHNVLRAINMASAGLAKTGTAAEAQQDGETPMALPQTLVRIPTEHAPALQAQAEAAMEESET